MSSCTHLGNLARLQEPTLAQSVHREECTQCFDNQDDPVGIDVCLTCFNGGCLDQERHHARTHVQKTGHIFTLNVQRKPKVSAHRGQDAEPPAKITKLAIVEEREEDQYDFITAISCWACDPLQGSKLTLSGPEQQTCTRLTNAVMSAMSSARKSEVQSWEEEIVACEHTLLLQQTASGLSFVPGLEHCGMCDLRDNLWLCLTCGSLGCGRKQYGGAAGGNGHGLQHFEQTGHGVSVKLGTITPEGGADIYCYICNDSKLDPEIALHLSRFGINVQELSKTEKTMTEINIEQNLKYDFSVVSEDGKALEPLSGPGFTGLSNLGNSCYMSSILQTLFSLPAFQTRYGDVGTHAETCPVALPADCIECQMRKVADGLLSGRYSRFSPSSSQEGDHTAIVSQVGVRPVGFKALLGRGHPEFSTMKQQDAEEFLVHLLDMLRRDERKRTNQPEGSGLNERRPTELFTFGMQERLQCGTCKRVRYRVDKMDVVSLHVPAQKKVAEQQESAGLADEWEPVDLESCLAALTAPEALQYDCPSCVKGVFATKQAHFATFPSVLVVHPKKFQLVNWVATKLDVPLIVPSEVTLDKYIGLGIQPNEDELPDDNVKGPEPQFDSGAMSMLEGMGFPTVRCKRALLATGNGNNVEAAMEWLFSHMEDPDIDDPIPEKKSSAYEPLDEQVAVLAEMGFTSAQARKALRETSGSNERAIEWLFSHPDDTGDDLLPTPSVSVKDNIGGTKELPAVYRLKGFVSHKGPSVHSGHYVAHVRTSDGDWVLFNDEKVVKADAESVAELRKLAYLYFFEKV